MKLQRLSSPESLWAHPLKTLRINRYGGFYCFSDIDGRLYLRINRLHILKPAKYSNSNPRMFIYNAEILLKDGSIKLYVGDVTIIK